MRDESLELAVQNAFRAMSLRRDWNVYEHGFYALQEIIEITSKGDRLPESLEIEEIAESALRLLADGKGELE